MTEIFEQFPYNNTGFKYKFCSSYIRKTLLLVHFIKTDFDIYVFERVKTRIEKCEFQT